MKFFQGLVFFLLICSQIGCEDDPSIYNPAKSPYLLVVEPGNFVSGGSISGNLFFPLTVGRTLTYLGLDGKDSIRVVEEVLDSIKVILGVDCRVVRAREWENNQLIEDTYDWYAQDLSGNVWYFGEYSQEIKNDVPVSTHGSWESGVDGALPGVIMFNEPIVGIWYRQEYYPGEAEDVAEILSRGESQTIAFGSFADILTIREWTPLEPGHEEHKLYAPGIGLIRAEATKGGSEFEELVSVTP